MNLKYMSRIHTRKDIKLSGCPEDYVTPKEYAKIEGVSKISVHNWIHNRVKSRKLTIKEDGGRFYIKK